MNAEYYMNQIHEMAEGSFITTAEVYCKQLYWAAYKGFIPIWHNRKIGKAFYSGWLMGMSLEALNELAGDTENENCD